MKKISLYILLMVITATVFGQNVYVVTKTTDPNPFTDKFDNDDNLCDPDMYGTLQWAINKVNYNSGESRIEFNIPGTGVHEISSNSYFPQIKNPVVIDGTTQAGYTTGSPVVKITGQMKTQYGFNVYNTTVTIKGLEISNFARSAIMLNECSNSKIIDNKIYNISFSGGYGLHILACNYTEIYGNRIEIDALPEYGRSSVGIYIDKCSYCTIGGTETGKANIIANCQKVGVVINSDKYNKVSGNSIYNNPKAIQLGSTANDNIQPPVITSYTNGILSGTALPNSTVEVFGSTGAENANEYFMSTFANSEGLWEVNISVDFDYLIATQISTTLNTSQLSTPIFTGGSTSGISCQDAVLIKAGNYPRPILSNMQTTEKWFRFFPDSLNYIIHVDELSNDSIVDFTSISLFRNSCNNLEELYSSYINDSLVIFADSLTIGSEYFIKVVAQSLTDEYFKLYCFHDTKVVYDCPTSLCQLIANHKFNYTSEGIDGNHPSPFVSDVNCWYKGWGSPQIFIDPDDHGKHARLFACRKNQQAIADILIYNRVPSFLAYYLNSFFSPYFNESIYTEVDVVEGENYELTFDYAVWNPGFSTVDLDRFVLTLGHDDTFTSYNYSSGGIYLQNGNPQQFIIDDSELSLDWRTKTIEFLADQSFTRLYIYPEDDSPAVNGPYTNAGWIKIDNVILKIKSEEIETAEVNTCSYVEFFQIPQPTEFPGTWSSETDIVDDDGIINPSLMTLGEHIFHFNTDDCLYTYNVPVIINDLPVINSVTPTRFCVNDEPVQLVCNPEGGVFQPAPYITFGGVFSPSIAEVGNHNVTYVYNDGICSNIRTFTLEVNSIPETPVLVASNNGFACPGSDITISVIVPISFDPLTYTWSGPDITSGYQGTDVIINNFGENNVGNYFVTVTDVNGCSNSNDIDLMFNPEPIMNISSANNCAGSTVNFIIHNIINHTSVLQLYNNGSLVWSYNSTSPVGNANIQGSYLAAGTYTFIYYITDGISQSCQYSETFVINPIPNVTISGPQYSCDISANLTAIATNIESYTWNNGSTSNIATVFSTGNYSVTVEDFNGCTNSANFNITFIPDPIINNGLDDICEGEISILIFNPVGFTGHLQIVDNIGNIVWSQEVYNQYGQITVETSTLTAGIYTLQYHLTNGGTVYCPYSETFTVLPNPDATITGDDFVCEDHSFLYASGGTSYLWNTGSIQNIIYINEAGTYSVVVTDDYGCTSEASFEVEFANEANEIITVFENGDPCSNIVQFIINPGGSFHAEIINNNDVVYHQDWFYTQPNVPHPINEIVLQPGAYSLSLTSFNGCPYTHDFAIPISCPQISISRKPGTCVYPYNGSVEVTIVDGTPPFQVYLGQSGGIVSPIYTFPAPGSYIIEGNDLLDGTQIFNVIVSDSDPYSPYSNAFPINAMYYQWTADNVITNNDFTESLYENLTICVGDANDQTLNITHDVTFKNCTIYCATNPYEDVLETLWAVEQENTLTLDNTTITSGCPDHLWKGVIVYGDIEHTNPYPPHYVTNFDLEPGQIIVKNNSKIMLADIGVVGFANAVVKITDSKFINCKTGTEFFVYVNHVIQYSQLPSVNPRAYIIRTEFITDNDYIVIPESHVNIYNTDKITLKGNKFINSVPNTMLSGSSRGKGVEGRNSTFSIIENQGLLNPPDFNILPQNKSVFEGLYYGVYVTNLSAGTATIRNCDFKNYDYMGVYLQNVTAPKVTSNTFDKEQFGVLTKNVGLYLKSCTGYNIENNTFNEGGYGMIVNNSGPNANKVYRNHFNNPYQGLHAYYTNSNTDGSLGLFIQCNDYHNNNGVQNFIKEGNVKKQQGYLSYNPYVPSVSAANQFEITNLVTNSESAFRTSWLYSFNDYKYWCNNFGDGITDITGYTSSTVTVDEIGFWLNVSEQCPSKLGHIAIDYEHEIATRKSDISSLNDNMDEIVDGGNTAQVLQKVQNLKPNNFNKTCNELLNLSPYLSDTVLVTFMQTGVNGHVVAKTNVLAANSPLPPHALAELENMDLPAPHKNYLAQMQTGTNAVVLLKDEIGNIEFNKNLYINEYVSHGLNNDSIPNVKDSVVNFLMNDDYFESKCIVIPILISDARYVDAQTQINELDYLASNQKPVLQAELSEFADLQELIILIDTTTSSESLLDVVENNLTMLETMAYNPSHRGSSVAQILLREAGIAEFEPEIYLPMEDRTMRFSIVEDAITESFDLNDMIEVYPTPASSEIWIEYLLIDAKPINKIDIYNVEGKLVLTQSIRNGFGLERVDVSQLSEGNYVLKMGDFSKQISIMK